VTITRGSFVFVSMFRVLCKYGREGEGGGSRAEGEGGGGERGEREEKEE
jgi:hypothetical protein